MFREIVSLYKVLHDIRLSRDSKERLIAKRLKNVLIESYQRVPYYRQLMKEIGYSPLKDYTGPEDLKNFPITTKKILKKYKVQMFLRECIKINKLFTDSTSGSTGIPLKVYRSLNERSYQIAKWLRVLLLNGYSFKDKVLSLTSPARLGEGKTFLQRFRFLRRLPVNYLLPVPEMVDIILDYKPHVLYGNRSHIDMVAMELLKREIKPEGLKLIIVGAEVIHDASLNLYKEAFNSNIIEAYASVEMGVIAFQILGEFGLHMCDDLTWFELLDKNGNPVLPGEPGRVIVTDLIGKTMPFIRYDQGDIAVKEIINGRDGKPESIISKIFGRDDDQIILADGSSRPFHDFYEVMDKYQGIKQFRVIQKKDDYFQIEVATNQKYFNETYPKILDGLHENFPGYCNFEIVKKNCIDPDLSGKLRMLVSELSKTD